MRTNQNAWLYNSAYHILKRAVLRSIRNHKTIEKKHPKLQNCKKMWTKPIPSCKTVKTDQFSHPSNQNPFWLNAVVTSGAYGGFVSIWDHAVVAHNCCSDGSETRTQKGRDENHIGYQIWKPISILDKSQKPNAKKCKICKQQWTPKLKNCKTKKIVWYKNHKKDLKIANKLTGMN